MRILVVLLIGLLLTTPCLAEQWFCTKDQKLVYIQEKLPNECKSYSSFRLKKPIVSRSNNKYKNIVETFDKRRAISYCVNN